MEIPWVWQIILYTHQAHFSFCIIHSKTAEPPILSFKSFEEINHSVPSFQRIIDINVYHYYWVSWFFFLVNYIWQLKFIENWGLWSTQYGLQLLCRKHAWVYYIIISNCQWMNQHHLDVTEKANIDESMLKT